MKTLITAVLLATLSVSIAFQMGKNELVDYRLKFSQTRISTFEDRDCTKTGLMCKNCNELVYCRFEGGAWTQLPQKSCPLGEVCRENPAGCFPDQNGECSSTVDVPFPCSTPGVFPNPGNCAKYHMCSPEKGSEHVLNEVQIDCENSDNYPNGYSYNPRTYFCDKKLPTTKKCSGYPVPICKEEFQSGALAENPSIYFICLNYQEAPTGLYPFQSACENGKKFSTTYGCQ